MATGNSIQRYPTPTADPITELVYDCEIEGLIGDQAGNIFFNACFEDRDAIYLLPAGEDEPTPVIVAPTHLDPLFVEDVVQLDSGPVLIYLQLINYDLTHMFMLDLLRGITVDLGVVGHLEGRTLNVSASAEGVSYFEDLGCTRSRPISEGDWATLRVIDQEPDHLCNPNGAAFVEQLGDGAITYVEAEGDVVSREDELVGPVEHLVANSGRLLVGVPLQGGPAEATIPFPEPWRIDRVDQVDSVIAIGVSGQPSNSYPGSSNSFPSAAHESTEILWFDLTADQVTTVPGNHGRLTRPLSPFVDALRAWLN